MLGSEPTFTELCSVLGRVSWVLVLVLVLVLGIEFMVLLMQRKCSTADHISVLACSLFCFGDYIFPVAASGSV